jgi:hypothetical protein
MTVDRLAFLNELLASEHGQNVASALVAQGLSFDKVGQVLKEVVGAAHDQANEPDAGLLGVPGGKNLIATFAAGLANGTGFAGSLKAGVEEALAGRISSALASKVGIDASALPGVIAAVTPLFTNFLTPKSVG